MKATLSIVFKHYEFGNLRKRTFKVQVSNLVFMVSQLYDIPEFRNMLIAGYFVKSFKIKNYEGK